MECHTKMDVVSKVNHITMRIVLKVNHIRMDVVLKVKSLTRSNFLKMKHNSTFGVLLLLQIYDTSRKILTIGVIALG